MRAFGQQLGININAVGSRAISLKLVHLNNGSFISPPVPPVESARTFFATYDARPSLRQQEKSRSLL